MAKDKNYMPQSTAGLIRYFDEYQDAIKIKPEMVVGISGSIVLFYILVRAGIIPV